MPNFSFIFDRRAGTVKRIELFTPEERRQIQQFDQDNARQNLINEINEAKAKWRVELFKSARESGTKKEMLLACYPEYKDLIEDVYAGKFD